MNYYPCRVWSKAFHIVILGLLCYYNIGVLNTCYDNISASLGWGDKKEFYLILFSTFISIGGVLGSLVAGSLMNQFGRRKSTMITDLLMIFASMLSLVPLTPVFAIGRLIAGFASGLCLAIGPCYLVESTPEEMLPQIGPLFEFSTDVGLIMCYSLGLPLPVDNFENDPFNWWWLSFFVCPLIMSLYQFCYFYWFCVYDSPLWLIRNGQRAQAELSILMVFTQEGLEAEMKRFENRDETVDNNENEVRYLDLFKMKKFRKMMRIGIILGILNQFSGINAVLIYSTDILQKLGGGLFMSRLYTFLTGLVFCCSALLAIPLLSKFGRRSLLISGQVLLMLHLSTLGALVSIHNSDEGYLLSEVFLIFLFPVFFAYSLGSTLWMYLGEVCNEKVLSVAAFLNLIAAGIVSGIFPIVTSYLDMSYNFYFFAICMCFGAVYSYFDLIETKDKQRVEILSKIYQIAIISSND
jgi:MFS family permease